MAAQNKFTLGLGIDLNEILRDTDAAIKKLEAKYRAAAARLSKQGVSTTKIRRQLGADVSSVVTQAQGRKLSSTDQKKVARFQQEANNLQKTTGNAVRQQAQAALAAAKQAQRQVNLGKERIAEIRRAINREKSLKIEENKIASNSAQLAKLKARRVAIEKAVLARAQLGQKVQASDFKGVPIRRIQGQTRADEGLDRARVNDEFLRANQVNEAELAKLSARERLTKERRVRLAQQEYATAKSRQVLEAEARSAVASERAKLERRLRVATQMNGAMVQSKDIEQDIVRLKAQTRNAEAKLARNTQAAATEVANAPGAERTTRFQRFQARQTGGDPTSQQRLGGFIKSRAISSAGFALSGVGIYGAIAAMRELITESSELEVQLSLIGSMWTSAFPEGAVQGSIKNVGDLKKEILDISLATATAADVTANVTRQLAGAFATVDADGDILPDFDRATREAEQALKIARTVGLPEQEITDSLTAVTIAFREQGVTFEQIGNLMVGLEAQYGVLGTELIQFTADLAPLGAELGFTAEQLTALGAVAQQSSGRSGAVIAEQLGRIIPALSDQSAAVLELFQSNTNTAGSVTELAKAFQDGDLPSVLSAIAGSFTKFSKEQRNALASMVGGRREAAVLFSILNDGEKTVKALGDTNFDDFAGDLDDRFEEISSNVKFKLDELRRNFEKFGLALFEAGLADAIIAAASAFSLFFQAINPVLGMLTSFNDLLGGIPLQLLLIAGGLKAIGAVNPANRFGRARDSVTSRVAVARAGGLSGARRGAGNLLFGSAAAGPGAAASGLLGTVAKMAPVFLAFEALNSFMDNTREQAEAAQATADKARSALQAADEQGPAALARTREDLQEQLEEERTGDGNIFADGRQNIIARGVNFVGGKGLNFFGKDGDAALRAAAGQDQDYQKIEQELARSKAEQYQDILDLVIENSDQEFIKALEGADLSVIADNIQANRSYISDAVKQLIGDDNDITATDFTAENIEALKEDAEAGNALSAHIIKLLGDFAESDSNADLLAAAQEIGELQGVGGTLPSIDLVKGQLDRGEVTTAEYVDLAVEIGNRWRQLASELDESSEKTQEYMARAASALADAQAAAAAIFTEDIDVEDFLGEITNPSQDPGERATQLARRLQQGRTANVSNEDLADIARELIEAERDAFQERIDATEDVEEQLRLAEEGTPFSKEALVAVGRLRAASGTTGEQIKVAAQVLGLTVDEITDTMVSMFEQYGTSSVDALLNIARGTMVMQIAAARQANRVRTAGSTSIRQIENSAAIMDAAIAQAEADFAETESALIGNTPDLFADPGNITGTADDSSDDPDKKRKEAMERELSVLNIAAANAGDDAVELARIAAQKARVSQKYAEGKTEENNALAEVIEADRAFREAVTDAAMQKELALLDIAAAQAGDDAVALAAIAQRRAGVMGRYADGDEERLAAIAQTIEADNQLRDAQNQRAQDNALAALDVAAARAGGDSVELARIAAERARIAGRFAKTQAEKDQALAQLIEADREMATSLFDLFASSAAILIAQADAAMNGVASAQEQLKVLRERMAQADALGLGPADRNNLQAEIIAQEAAVRDAKLAEEREMIDFQLQMGQITEGQAIAALQSLAAIPGLAEKQVREIQLEIKRMKDALGSNMQFNLPTNLALPTAYEVRRYSQSGASPAGGYNDNRNITVSVQVATDASPEAIASAVTAAVGDPTRNGTIPKKY